jgi:hypothetical protein
MLLPGHLEEHGLGCQRLGDGANYCIGPALSHRILREVRGGLSSQNADAQTRNRDDYD